MRSRSIIIFVLTIFLATGVFCAVKRQTYTDIVSEDNYLDKLSVAVMRTGNVGTCCATLDKDLSRMPIVLKVKCVGEREYLYGAGQQLVHVEEVYKGNELINEEEIYVYSRRWTICVRPEPNSVSCGFINIMEPGEEYLLFLTGEKVELARSDVPIYRIYDDTSIMAVFLFGEREHMQREIDASAGHTYVPYTEVKGNEMFAETEAGYEIWLELKEKLFEQYVEGKEIPENDPLEDKLADPLEG